MASADGITIHAIGGKMSPANRSILALAIIGLIMLFVWVAAIDNSPVLPGNWTSLVPAMEFYFGAYGFCLILVALNRHLLAGTETTLSSFLLRMSGFAGATWLILSGAIYLTGGVGALLDDTERLQDLVFVGVFVAPVEEAIFRWVLPALLDSWILGSIVGFTLFHIPAYLVENGGTVGAGFLGSLIVAALLGFVLWLVYATPKEGGILGMGYPATVGIHFAYDVIVLGAVSGIPLAFVHLGLVPL